MGNFQGSSTLGLAWQAEFHVIKKAEAGNLHYEASRRSKDNTLSNTLAHTQMHTHRQRELLTITYTHTHTHIISRFVSNFYQHH